VTDRSIFFLPRSISMAALPAAAPVNAVPFTVRDLLPTDADLLDELHAGLSDTSRYQRYQTPKPRLTSADRRYLAATDGEHHIALLAFDPSGAPIASARAVRSRVDPASAEIAAEVIDPLQHNGIGTDLVHRLARRAIAVGIHRFTATVLSQTGLSRSLGRRGWRIVSFDGPTTDLEVEVWTLMRA
jgi:GNAT superfamily N-acetyltransferase